MQDLTPVARDRSPIRTARWRAGMGLIIPSSDAVSLGYVRNVQLLLAAIDEAIQDGSILYIEGTSIAPEIRTYLESHQAPWQAPFPPGTIYPIPERFALVLLGTNLADLRRIADHYPAPEVCDHLAVCRGTSTLLSAPDAGFDEVFVSSELPPATITRLKDRLRRGAEE